VADIREQILARLVTVCAGVTGIVSAGRNLTDVPLMARPAVLINGGAEEMVSSPRPSGRFSEVQIMALTPGLTLLVRSDTGPDAGALMSLFRGRLVNAILADTTLRSLVTTNGAIRYDGCNETDPSPESKEPRLELQIVFIYPLKLSDLAA
jgi:hypothetical protein